MSEDDSDLALSSAVSEDRPDGVRALNITKDQYKALLADMIHKRKALGDAITALWRALDLGALGDPPQSANAGNVHPPETPEGSASKKASD